MAYPTAMHTPPVLSQELWVRIPPEVRAYNETLDARQASRGALAARVATLAAMGQALQAQLNPTSRHASRPPASAPPTTVHVILGVSAGAAGTRGTRGIRAPGFLWTQCRRRWSSRPSRVGPATHPDGEMIPGR